MTTKEKLKSEIDKIPEELASKVYKLILSEQNESKKSIPKKKITGYHLGKELDEIDLRKAAYE